MAEGPEVELNMSDVDDLQTRVYQLVMELARVKEIHREELGRITAQIQHSRTQREELCSTVWKLNNDIYGLEAQNRELEAKIQLCQQDPDSRIRDLEDKVAYERAVAEELHQRLAEEETLTGELRAEIAKGAFREPTSQANLLTLEQWRCLEREGFRVMAPPRLYRQGFWSKFWGFIAGK